MEGEHNVPTNAVACWDCGQGAVRAVRYSADGNYCLTPGGDKSIKLWSISQACSGNTSKAIHTFLGHGAEPLDVRASHDNARLVSGGADKLVMIWDVADGSALCRFRGHAAKINCVSFGGPDSNVVISASVDSTVKLWDCRSRPSQALIQTLDDAKDTVSWVTAVKHQILTASADGFVRVYDLRCGQLYADYVGGAVLCAAFTRDQQCILAAAAGQPIRLLDLSTGRLLQEFTGHAAEHEYQVEVDVFAGDSLVVSGSEDGHACIWDVVQAKLIAKLHVKPVSSSNHPFNRPATGPSVVHSLSTHPTKPALLTASQRSVTVWHSNSS